MPAPAQEGGGAEVVISLRRGYAYALRNSLLRGYAADTLNMAALEGGAPSGRLARAHAPHACAAYAPG